MCGPRNSSGGPWHVVGDPLLNQGLGNVLKQFHWPQNAVPEHYHTTACGYLITARLVPRRRTLAHAPTTSVSHDRSGRQMDLPPRHGRPPAGSVSMLGFYLAGHATTTVVAGAFTRSASDRVRNFRHCPTKREASPSRRKW